MVDFEKLKSNKTDDNNLLVPEKFKDPQTGEIKTQDLLKSYLALEKKLSDIWNHIIILA